jgi:hypothetical protein
MGAWIGSNEQASILVHRFTICLNSDLVDSNCWTCLHLLVHLHLHLHLHFYLHFPFPLFPLGAIRETRLNQIRRLGSLTEWNIGDGLEPSVISLFSLQATSFLQTTQPHN